ncbi:hypothetical protein GCK72_010477 [Caenorhabditis remanei]|uniref:Uncharacterized protein n=1 Tax=Caenorhabditis remanei TaxID=31234 RepID=A0A6A5H586_CAERE|nr:hypothetical protein GCK72_010477 [Caenorhabditis remanei]KAF1762215.1 hypothetical protein GCK72_010477 [Caenorhabditis remanei]
MFRLSTKRKLLQKKIWTNFRNPRVQQLFDNTHNTNNYSNQQAQNTPRYPTNTEYSKQPEHSAYRENSQDDRNAQNPETNLERSRSHDNESVSNQQRFLQNYPRFTSESNHQLESKVNSNIDQTTCELCQGRHPLSACTVNKGVLMRYCATTGRCMECTSLLYAIHNCPLRLMKKVDAE